MSRRSVCTVVMVAALSSWVGTPAWAQSSLSLNLGYFVLRGEDTRIPDDVIVENLGLFAFDLEQFNNTSVGAEWLSGLGTIPRWGSGSASISRRSSVSIATLSTTTAARIEQDFKLRVTPVTATLRFFPFGKRNTIQPYAGAGVGFFNWRYSEVGEFIDFNTFDVFRDQFVAADTDVGAVYLGGVRVRVGSRYGVGLEVKYQDAKGVVGIDQGFLADGSTWAV